MQKLSFVIIPLTHYHLDHAGVAQELKLAGVPLLVLDVQVLAIPLMKTWTKLQDEYVDITMDDNVTISFPQNRSLLEQIGIPGEILHTPTITHNIIKKLDQTFITP